MTMMLLEWVLTSIFLILAVLALRAVFGRRVSARLRYALWAVVLLRLLVPVQLFTSPLAGTRFFSESRTGQTVAHWPITSGAHATPGPDDVLSPDLTGEPLTNFPAAPQAPDPPTVPIIAPAAPAAPDLTKLPVWLGWVWLGGSIALALVLAASNLRFALRLRRSRIPLEEADCPLPVYEAVGLPSPCLFGLARPAVYVTRSATADPAMLRHVLAHEYTHFRQGDHIWSFLRCAALAVHWWNPLVWLAVALSRRDGELACDEGALKRLGDGERLAYGHTLLALVTAKPGPGDLLCFATTMAGEKRSLKERVSRIAHAPKRWLWAAVAVVLATVLACACAFGQAQEPETADGPDPAPTPSAAAGSDTDPAANPDPEEAPLDLNRNGVLETVQVTELDGGAGQRLELREGDELIFAEEGFYSHAGWNALFLCAVDGEGYLLRYNPYGNQGVYHYSYQLFTLENGVETAVRENHVEFDVNFGLPIHAGFDPEAIAAFMDEINGLLAHSVQLINTDDGLLRTFQEEGRLYDGRWWPDTSVSRLESLRAYQASMEASYRSVLLGKSQFILIQDEAGYLYSIEDVPALICGDDPYARIWIFAVVDMDGDGTDEVMVQACGVAGDSSGYLLLRQENGVVYGTIFNAHNNWSNRWFWNLKADGTFACSDILDSWSSISKLYFTAGGGTGVYGLTVIRNNPDYDLGSIMAIQNEVTREEDWLAALESQEKKPDAVWYDFNEENITAVWKGDR